MGSPALSSVHPASYATTKSSQSFSAGVHYLEVSISFTSRFAGVGVFPALAPLPGHGIGAWLNGAHQWGACSGA